MDEFVVYELWVINVLQDTFPCIYSGLYGLAPPCIYSLCKNCVAVCIYNNTACSHCVCALHDYLDVASHGFMCWSVIGPCLSAPFSRGVFLPVSKGFVMTEQAGRVSCVCVSVCLCERVCSLERACLCETER